MTEVATTTGFCKRGRKFTPLMFIDILLYNSTSDCNRSLNQLTIETLSEHGICISKQGIDKRFTQRAVEFIKTVFEKALAIQIQAEGLGSNWQSKFQQLRIKDGTRFDIPDEFHEILPGSGGSASKAGVCIQYEYDIKSGKILDLTITPASRPDTKDAKETMLNLQKDDLVIRDLGYFSLEVVDHIIQTQAWLISRIESPTNIYIKKNSKIKRLDFAALYRLMSKQKLRRLEIPVLIGKIAMIPLRLLIELMPDEIYENRMRKINKWNKKKGRRTSHEYAQRARFNLFITNIDQKTLTAYEVSTLYKVRWQIELVFKIWKSTFGIDNTRKMKYHRWLCLFYAKLLIIVINWKIIMEHRAIFYKTFKKILSTDKCYKTLKNNVNLLRKAILEGDEAISKLCNKITLLLANKHWLENKNKKMGFEKLINVLNCKSD